MRTPSLSFAEGITTANLGKPDVGRALEQHAAYVEALRGCGLEVMSLPADEDFPDSTFVEDTAVLTAKWGVIARPGASSRMGEILPMRKVLETRFTDLTAIEAPGTLDGGDVCEWEGEFWVGLSGRTNEEGAAQFKRIVEAHGATCQIIDIQKVPGLLHLKTAVARVAPGLMVASGPVRLDAALSGLEVVEPGEGESYAANCVRVNDRVLVAAGHPNLTNALKNKGLTVVEVEMSEFQKMDGGLSCLSLRY
ncbi:MAG: N(G),N(G)-dimethylarginine dimethylaminohydrolase [Polyangiaceae bacterium]|nr:N(G),N(G)-dimethylarginine dimethylaminohydrolase [Polyangiaceae bacterium]